jgi:hypothetical protein
MNYAYSFINGEKSVTLVRIWENYSIFSLATELLGQLVKQDENLRLIATGYRIETCRRA